MERVRVYGDGGMASKTGVGIFARALLDRFPLLPVEKDKAELLTVIGDYHKNLVPLVVPLTLLKPHLTRIPVPYIQEQVYLS